MTEPQYYLAGYLVDLAWQPREASDQGVFIASIDGLPEAWAEGETKAEALAALSELLESGDLTS